MQKLVNLLAVTSILFAFISCSKESSSAQHSENLELRAQSLGFADVASYKAYVAEQCAADNHENCCLQNYGKHQACPHLDHERKNRDGEHQCGTNHEKNGHSQGTNGSHGQNGKNCNSNNCR